MILLAVVVLFTAAQAVAQVEQGRSTIGYPTVAAALATLRAKPGSEVSMQNGWMVVSEPSARAVWSFTPAGHPAHPALVRRGVVTEGSTLVVKTDVLCQAAKAPCDQLVLEFRVMNNTTRDGTNGRR